jgi:membrane peptidoglycan carboxypeptidase
VVDGKINGRTGANMSLGSQESTGKTGTTDSNSAVWFAGYTPQLSAAVWVGDPRGAFKYPMTDVTINGVHYNELYGGELPGPIWKQAMQGALANSPTESFDLQAKYGLTTAAQGGGPDPAKSLALAAAKKSGSYTPPFIGGTPVTVKYTKDDPNKPGAPAPEVIDQNSSGSQNSSGQSGTNNGASSNGSTSPYGTNTYNNGN